MSLVGFKTAKGSVYAVDEAKAGHPKRTTRLKVSYGEGRGTLCDAPSSCLFVSEAGADLIENALVAKKRVVMLYHAGDESYQQGQPLTAITAQNASDVPAARNFFFGVVGANNEWESLVSAYPEPKPGLRPMEQEFETDGSLTNHIGHAITDVFDHPSQLVKATLDAAKTLNHTSSRVPPRR